MVMFEIFPLLALLHLDCLDSTRYPEHRSGERCNIKFACDVHSGYVDSYVLISVRSPPTHNLLMYSVTICHMIMTFIQRFNLILKYFSLFYSVDSSLIQIVF